MGAAAVLERPARQQRKSPPIRIPAAKPRLRGKHVAELLERWFRGVPHRDLGAIMGRDASSVSRYRAGRNLMDESALEALGKRLKPGQRAALRLAWERDAAPRLQAENDRLRERVEALEADLQGGAITPSAWGLSKREEALVLQLLQEARRLPYGAERALSACIRMLTVNAALLLGEANGNGED